MTKIGLDVAALTKLVEALGPEFELQLQRAVLENFAKNHVKAFIDKYVKEVLINNAILEQVGVYTQKGWNSPASFKPAESFKAALDLLRAEIVAQIKEEKSRFAVQCYDEAKVAIDAFKKEITETIQAHVERTVKTAVEADIAFRVKDAVKKKLEEIHKAAEIG